MRPFFSGLGVYSGGGAVVDKETPGSQALNYHSDGDTATSCNHLTVETLPQILVGIGLRAGPLISAAPDSRGTVTDICSGILTVR